MSFFHHEPTSFPFPGQAARDSNSITRYLTINAVVILGRHIKQGGSTHKLRNFTHCVTVNWVETEERKVILLLIAYDNDNNDCKCLPNNFFLPPKHIFGGMELHAAIYVHARQVMASGG